MLLPSKVRVASTQNKESDDNFYEKELYTELYRLWINRDFNGSVSLGLRCIIIELGITVAVGKCMINEDGVTKVDLGHSYSRTIRQ